MNVSKKEFLDVVDRLQEACNGEPNHRMRKLADEAGVDFDYAHQTAVAVFVTQKGKQEDIDVLRNYLKEAYTGKNLSVEFKEG